MDKMKEMFSLIETRQKKLYEIGEKLKSDFVGLDDIIDEILRNIQAWYVIPELVNYPTIICLWGLTGVGKTDLVRKLVRYMGMYNVFLEVQMKNKDTSYIKSLDELFKYTNITTHAPGIVLLDEMQKYRTIDEDGNDIDEQDYSDVWELLSDGKFSSKLDVKSELLYALMDEINIERDKETLRNKKKKKNISIPNTRYNGEELRLKIIKKTETKKITEEQKRDEKIINSIRSYHQANRLKNLLQMKEPVEIIMNMPTYEIKKLLYIALSDNKIYESQPYNKLLIIISGNLDEAFHVAGKTDEADIDADVFHEATKKIKITDIKNALRRRFKPEQISRFGNNHIIYPSLSKQSYKEIIKRRVGLFVKEIKDKSNISITIDETVYDLIYRNGVFPVQGTRPVFSTIGSIIESNMPKFLLYAIKNKIKSLTVYYNDGYLYCMNKNDIFKVRCEGKLDIIRNEKSIDLLTYIACHEVGHGLVFAELFGICPFEILINTTESSRLGYSLHYLRFESKTHLLHDICVCVAGRAAEEIVFGENEFSSGAEEDIHKATTIAGSMFRNLGMGSKLSKNENPHVSSHPEKVLYDLENTGESDIFIQKTIKEQYNKAKKIIKNNIKLFTILVDNLIDSGKITKEQFKKLSDGLGYNYKIKDTDKTIIKNYNELYDKFKSKI